MDMSIASAVSVGGAAGITLHDALANGQLLFSITASAVGAGYIAWKWHKDIRYAKRRDRRASDKKQTRKKK